MKDSFFSIPRTRMLFRGTMLKGSAHRRILSMVLYSTSERVPCGSFRTSLLCL